MQIGKIDRCTLPHEDVRTRLINQYRQQVVADTAGWLERDVRSPLVEALHAQLRLVIDAHMLRVFPRTRGIFR